MTDISDDIRQRIRDTLSSSGLKFYNSKKSKGTLVIRGDLVAELIQQPELLSIVDKALLNIWSNEYKDHVYTFVQSREGMNARYRDFGLFQFNQKANLPKLREDTKLVVPIDESRPEWYPWKFKLKLRKTEDYYFTQDWIDLRNRFYNSKNRYATSCRCCEQEFVEEEQLLLNLHHKVTIRNGGNNTFLNLVSLCVACHSLVHYDKQLLIESLFAFYSDTGSIGNEKIRRALLRYDDVVTRFSQRSYLDLYDRLVEKMNRKEAKIFFFQKLLESFRYLRDKSFYNYSNYYFKVSKHVIPSDQESWLDLSLACRESTHDLCVFAFLIHALVDRIEYFEGRIIKLQNDQKAITDTKESQDIIKAINSLKRGLENTNEELKYTCEHLTDYLMSGVVTHVTIADLLLIVRGKRFFVNSSFIGRNPYEKPTAKEKLAYYEVALARRNALLSDIVNAFSSNADSNEQKLSNFFISLKDCIDKAGIAFSLQDIMNSVATNSEKDEGTVTGGS